MTLASQTSDSIIECAPSLKGCRICRRPGLAILPLRRSLVPKAHFWMHLPEPEISDTQLGMRILRAGYLYVLLDDKVWQGYQVTVDGFLRQFNPYLPPCANERRLNRACMHLDHDMPASFLNIDTDEYRSASFAFSSDPWPVSVLQSYKSLRHIERMQMIDLATACDNPTQYGNYLTPDDPWVQREVYEYRDFVPSFPSVHGFHSRAHRQSTFRNHLRTAHVHPTLGPGVLAIEVDDDVGLVQEYNAMRAIWAHARQVWIEEPERAYQHQTSQILLAIRALHRQWADAKVRVDAPPLPPNSLEIPGAWEKRRAKIVEERARDSDERLEERYDEPKRSAFQNTYDTVLGVYQEKIDQYAELYAKAFNSADFHVAMEHDYDGDDRQSGIAYSKTMALCLRGGISEAAGNDTGPTVMLWKEMLQDPQSPIYKALLMRDKSLLAGLLPSFDVDGVDDWNDSIKLYAALRAVVASSDNKLLTRKYLQESIAEALSAANAAGTRLKSEVKSGTTRALLRINTAAQLLYNRVALMQLHIPMKLGDYYALQSKFARELQHQTSNGAHRTQSGAKNNPQPLIFGGLLSVSAMNPKVANIQVMISAWFQGTLNDLDKFMVTNNPAARTFSALESGSNPLSISLGPGTLDSLNKRMQHRIEISEKLARQWVRSSFKGLKSVAGSSDVLLAVGGLYLMHDSLSKNMRSAQEAINNKSDEAQIALAASSIAVLGGGLELVGIVIKAAASASQSSTLITSYSTAATRAAQSGHLMIRVGAITVSLTGFLDAAQSAIASKKAFERGEKWSAFIYMTSAVLSITASIYGVLGSIAKTSVFWGPIGISAGLVILAYTAYKWAEKQESTPLETWAKRCYFGFANETPKIHWQSADQAYVAIAELNAIIIGMRVVVIQNLEHVGHAPGNLPTGKPHWRYKISLPYYYPERSAFQWQFVIHRKSHKRGATYINDETIAHGEISPPVEYAKQITITSSPNYTSDNQAPLGTFISPPSQDGNPHPNLEIRGSLKHTSTREIDPIEAATLWVIYWPDRNLPESYSEITTTQSIKS